jgi:hypothetical protein
MIQGLWPNLENTITATFQLCALGYRALPDFTTLFTGSDQNLTRTMLTFSLPAMLWLDYNLQQYSNRLYYLMAEKQFIHDKLQNIVTAQITTTLIDWQATKLGGSPKNHHEDIFLTFNILTFFFYIRDRFLLRIYYFYNFMSTTFICFYVITCIGNAMSGRRCATYNISTSGRSRATDPLH